MIKVWVKAFLFWRIFGGLSGATFRFSYTPLGPQCARRLALKHQAF